MMNVRTSDSGLFTVLGWQAKPMMGVILRAVTVKLSIEIEEQDGRFLERSIDRNSHG